MGAPERPMNWPTRVLFALGLAGVLSWPGALMAIDVIVPPPAFEAHNSASGRYVLELALRSGANAHAARATATLLEMGTSSRKPIWTRELAHRPRPRFALVSDEGHVVLLDEWLNVRSDLAVMLIDKHNRTLAVHSLEAVRAALAVPSASLAPQARHGLWMQAPPAINAQGAAAEVAAAGQVLVIRLRDGALSRR